MSVSADETWTKIPGWEGLYEASSLGRVRSISRTVKTKRGPWQYSSRILAQTHNKMTGYHYVCLCRPGKEKFFAVHQLVAMAFMGPCPTGMEVCHKNGVRVDSRAVNLRYGTKCSNEADKVNHGTRYRGEHHPNAKLTAEDVRRIKLRLAETDQSLGTESCVSPAAIREIRVGNNWKHVNAANDEPEDRAGGVL